MIQFVRNYLFRSFIALILFLWFGSGSLLSSSAQQPNEVVQWDQAMRIPSPEDSGSWFPDLAVDSQGRVHVVWNETKSEVTGDVERVFYSMWNGDKWSTYNDIVPPQPDIIRQAVAVDSYDVVHLVFGWMNMFYKRAQSDQAFSAAGWTSPDRVNSRGLTYSKDIAIYEDTIHVVYDDRGAGDQDSECPTCVSIFYRNSPNRGFTWSTPQLLLPGDDRGSARSQIEVDERGSIFITWDQGWDRLSGYTSDKKYGVYVYSTDAGNSWSTPQLITYPDANNIQLTVGTNGEGGVILVWRTESPQFPGIYYMWSEDFGTTWSPPKTLPGIVSRTSSTPFDMYDMATDSAGHIHLLVVGRLGSSNKPSPGLYHFEWDGQAWSEPTALYEGTWYPEYPNLVVHEGNQLHATWFMRQDLFQAAEPNQIWYAHGQSSAPAVVSEIRPTSTPIVTPAVIITPTPSPTPTSLPTPTPTLDPIARDVVVPEGVTESIYTDMDDIFVIGLSLFPALIVISLAVIVARGWRR